MKKIILLITAMAMGVVLTGASLSAQEAKKAKAPAKKTAEATVPAAVYSCPMHPEVTADKPGKCPKCGMFLEKKEVKAKKAAATTAYSCPMHPEVTSDQPGKCTECGMKLEQCEAMKGDARSAGDMDCCK